ncbi:MAG TPA: hypothetical protein VK981_06860 [Ramlibacter sp.]|nr:hypothetical protein [Ramlibacter sp.]
MKRLLLALFLLLAVAAAPAATGVPEGVKHVVTGGFWSADGKSGTYRVVVINEGSEQVTSRVHVEWLAQTPTGLVIVASVEPRLPFGNGVANLRAALRPDRKGGRALVQVEGVMAADPNQKVTTAILASTPGKVVVGTLKQRGKRPPADGTT